MRQIDFGFMFCRVSRFYGMSFAEVRDIPIRAFWLMGQMIDRLRAEEILEWLPAHGSAMGGEHVKDFAEQLERRIGKPMVVEQTKATAADLDKLRQRFGGGVS